MSALCLDKADIQGNILRGYTFPVATHLLVRIGRADAGRRWLGSLLELTTTAEEWPKDDKPKVTHNMAFTAAGLRALGVPEAYVESCAPAFLQGMASRAKDVLGDDGASDPECWEHGLGNGGAHVLVSVHAADDDRLERALTRLRQGMLAAGIEVVHEQAGQRLDGDREHFGFADGMGQPSIAGVYQGSAPDGVIGWFNRRRPLPPGEFLLGHRDLDGVLAPGPPGPLGENSTYLVYRKLRQNVAAFRTFVQQQAVRCSMDEELLKAKIVGRWPDGTPLILSPERSQPEIARDPDRVNDFHYNGDPDGARCPLGAHIRRTNPRDALADASAKRGFGSRTAMSARHRMIRRGMPYVDAMSNGGRGRETDRGLLFMCFVGDIERQFEFVQTQWCNDGNAFRLGRDTDLLVGTRNGKSKMVIHGPKPRVLSPLPPFVTTRGGEYFLVPSIRGLRALAAGRVGG